MIQGGIRKLLLHGTCGVIGIAVLIVVARSISLAARPEGFHIPLLAVAAVAAPFAVYFAFRYPLIFPFGLYVALVPFDNILQVTSGATYVRLVAGLAGLALLARMLLLRRFVKPATGWYAWAAFVAWAGVSLIWTPDLAESQRVYGIVLQNFLMMTVLALYPVREIEFRWLGILTVASGLLAGVYAFTHHTAMGGGRISLNVGNLVIDPNQFATSFVLPIALCLAVALSSRDVRLKILCAGAVIFMMAPILMTASRGGVVAICLLFAFFAIRSKHRVQILVVAGICLALTAFYPAVWERFSSDEGQMGSGSGRTYIWAVGLHAIKQDWLLGTGIGSFLETYDRNFLAVFQPQMQGWHRPSHDIIIGTWVEMGFVGLVIVLAAWYTTFRQLRVISPESKLYPIRLALEGALVALFAQSLFIDPIWIKYVWLAQSFPLLLLNLHAPRQEPAVGKAARRAPLPARIARQARV
jgi:O-antigen ligase